MELKGALWGRLEVVKADLLPSLNYLAYVFPVPFWYGRKLEKLVFSFLWKNSTEMVARSQMYRLMREGGRGVPCIPLKMEAIFCSWAARIASLRDELVEGVEKAESPYGVSWTLLQPSYLTGFCKDLNWLTVLGRLPVRERLYRHGSGRSPKCPIGCGQDETIEHVFWTCPGAGVFWRSIMQWWERWGGPIISRNLVLYGVGLEGFVRERRRIIWSTISEGKHVLWESRTVCLRKLIPRLESKRLFLQLLGKMSEEAKAFKVCYGEEVTRRVWRGLQRVGGG